MIEIKTVDLKTAIQGFQKVLGRQFSLPVCNHIRVKQIAREITLTGTNLDEYATYRIKRDSTDESIEDILVPFDRLQRIVKGMSNKDSLKFQVKDDCISVIYKVGGNEVELKLPTLPLKDWPEEPKIDAPSIQLNDKFKAALKAAMDCTSVDQSRFVLRGVCIDVTNPTAHYIVGADGLHLFSANSFCFDLKQSIIIPNRKFITWTNFIEDGPWIIQPQDKTCVKLQSDHWTYLTKQIEGPYPAWQQVVPSLDYFKTFIAFNQEGVNLLINEILPQLPGKERDHSPVTLIIRDNWLIVEGRNEGDIPNITKITVPGATIRGAGSGPANGPSNGSSKGPPIIISVNRNFMLKAFKYGLTEMAIADSCSPMLFHTEGKKMVVMPIRTEHFEPEADEQSKEESKEQSNKQATDQATTQQIQDNHNAQDNTPAESSSIPNNPNEQQNQEETIQNMTTTEPTTRGTPDISSTNHTTNRIAAFENAQTGKEVNPIKLAIQQVEQIKDSLKETVSNLTEVIKTLNQAQREHRNTEKEVEAIRDSLKVLQKVKI